MFSKEYIELEPIILRDSSGFYYRDRTDDLSIVKEILNGAWSDLDVQQSDNVLDLGAHIGLSSSLFIKKTASVTSVEADPRAARLIPLNAPNTKILEGVVEYADGETTFYLSRNPTWRQSTSPGEGAVPVTLPTYSFRRLSKNVTVIKCDIEGGERALPWHKVPSTVRVIGIEIHNYHDNKEFVKEFFTKMRKLGFRSKVSKVTKPSRPEDKVFILKRKNSL